MAKEVLMPKLSSTMTHGSVTEWYKNVGDYVKVGEPLFEVMTDKIAIEVESYDEGYVLKKLVEVNDEIECNSVIAYLGEKNEEIKELLREIIKDNNNLVKQNRERKEENISQVNENINPTHNKVRATPAARKLARKKNVDLDKYDIGGRISLEDVRRIILEQTTEENATNNSNVEIKELIPWTGARKVIANAMVQSSNEIPHVTLNASADMTQLLNLRKKLNNQQKEEYQISITDVLIYFVSRVLINHSLLNSNTDSEGIHIYKNVNIGIAVALEKNLIVPVIKNTNKLSLLEISKNNRGLIRQTREGTLAPEHVKGGTFSITSIGRGKIKNFTPIINYPETAILGVGSLYKELKYEGEKITNKDMVDLSLSFDHRAIDGYPASLFLTELIEVLESPELILLT